MSFDLNAYLERIGLRGPLATSLDTLATVQWAHLQTVPFENLEIRPLHREIRLDDASLFDKIVNRRRGGFCYELNGLLSQALEAIGFGATIVSVQFVHDDATLSPLFDHMALIVSVPGEQDRFVVDVGAGSTAPARPLRLVDGHAEYHPETRLWYRLRRHEDAWQMDVRDADSEWKANNQFTEIPRAIPDFSERCRYQYEAPDSHFTQGPICSKNIFGGRLSVSGRQFIRTVDGVRTEHDLSGNEEFESVLRELFGIDLARERIR
jgi:N-hydroxyarylamine O-acetyltransferase